MFHSGRITGALLATALLASALPAVAETPVGSNIDSRVSVALKANAEGVQALMPEGWTSIPFPQGPLKGANTLLVLIDQHLARDPEGAPVSPPTRLAAALVGLGKETQGDGVRLYVMKIFTTNPDSDPYGNAVAAEIARTRTLEGNEMAGRQHTESWTIQPASGGEIAVSLDYQPGTHNWVSDEAFPYSAVNPDFSRIYRYDQLVDLAMSTAIGKPLAGTMAFDSSAQDLAGVFDGTQEVIAVLSVPVYVREISLP